MAILIATPSLHPHDAVSNDVLQLRRFLLEANEETLIYSEFADPSIRSLIADRRIFAKKLRDPANVFMYHHSVEWLQGEELINQASCRVLLKYHNITPSNFFSYDPVRMHVTALGREQTKRFIESGKFTYFVGASNYNSQELMSQGAPPEQTKVIAPFHRVHDFDDVAVNDELANSLKDGRFHVLFVGRVAPNKGHKHLMRTISRYVDFYGKDVCLHVIGGILPGDGPYLQEVEDLIHELGIGSVVTFHNKLDFRDLHTYYSHSHAFLLMSEHEGFCVPILEAQYHKLPIVAWDQCAVGETMGKDQLVLSELDYDTFAVALRRVMTDENLRQDLAKSGEMNFRKYEAPILLQKTQELLYD